MILTNKQKEEIDCLEYFILNKCDYQNKGEDKQLIINLYSNNGELICKQ